MKKIGLVRRKSKMEMFELKSWNWFSFWDDLEILVCFVGNLILFSYPSVTEKLKKKWQCRIRGAPVTFGKTCFSAPARKTPGSTAQEFWCLLNIPNKNPRSIYAIFYPAVTWLDLNKLGDISKRPNTVFSKVLSFCFHYQVKQSSLSPLWIS